MQSRNNSNIKGIDVSNWQGYVNFAKVKTSGVKIVYMKASEGISYKDKFLERNYQNAKKQGLKIGFYHFFRGNAIAEARHFINCIKGKQSDCKLALDIESNCGMNKTTLTTACIKFLEEVKRLTGQQVLVYTYSSFAKSILDKRLSKYPLWVAEYGVHTPQWNPIWNSWVGFQYSSSGNVNGVKGRCDVNEFNSGILMGTKTSTSTLTLKRGSQGEKVKEIQNILIKLEYLHDKVDGIYGQNTYNAVLVYQKKHNALSNDGIVGSQTYNSLKVAYNNYLKSIKVKQSNIKVENKKEEYDMDKIILYYGDADVFSAIILSQKYGCSLMKESDFKIKGYKAKQIIKVGGTNANVSGKDRFETFKNAGKLL